MIGNGAEGEPGSFKDRYLLHHLPYPVLEGFWIAAWVVGAERAILFICEGFEEEIAAVRRALEEIRHAGLWTKSSPPLPEIEVFAGPDFYLAGEETALLEILEGRPPFPRQKPPYYPSVHGLFGRPTLVQNVETLANVPAILQRGADAFRQFGTPESPGTFLFSLSGDVERPGVYEFPLGTPLREVIGAGGGVAGGKRLKAVFPGGHSFGLITAAEIDIPLTFETLREAGSGLGAGCVTLLSEERCMVRAALRYASFFKGGSCGQCPPCQMGTHNLTGLLERILEGASHPGTVDSLLRLSGWMPGRGACGLISGAARCVGSLVTRFREEFEAHERGEGCGLS
ncbi:MAG: SLBB domain-containing protein [Nitrospirae bacterium]|nr:SLBB domain-containing protein [Nitrospirota bacterium]